MIETCRYCGTEYEVPPGHRSIMGSTRDIEPPARVGIYVFEGPFRDENGKILIDFNKDLVHMCNKGKPVTEW